MDVISAPEIMEASLLECTINQDLTSVDSRHQLLTGASASCKCFASYTLNHIFIIWRKLHIHMNEIEFSYYLNVRWMIFSFLYDFAGFCMLLHSAWFRIVLRSMEAAAFCITFLCLGVRILYFSIWNITSRMSWCSLETKRIHSNI